MKLKPAAAYAVGAILAAVAAGALGAGSVSCGDARTTALVVGVSTQARVPKDLATVTVLVEPRAGGVGTCSVLALDGTRTLVVRASGAAGQELRVTVSGFAEASVPGACSTTLTPKVVRRARARLVDGEELYLPMPLRHACFGVGCDAASDQTCAAGACVPDDSVARGLTRYDETSTSGETSFCLSKVNCFDDRVPGLLLDDQTCDFRMTADVTSAKGVNVEFVHEDLTREVLDVDDPVEGYTLDPDHPERFRLAPGLCDRVRKNQVAAVSVGVGCPSKRALNPMCAGVAGVGSPDAGLPEAPELCTSGAELAPAASAVYLLADRSRAMAAYYTNQPTSADPDSVPFAESVDLLLRSPELRRTQVAFRALPAAASDCGGDAFATPEIAFHPANDAHAAVSAVFADRSRVLPDDPPLFLDAALQPNGAYAAFASLGAPGTLGVADVLLFYDRDLWTHCAATGTKTTPDLAFDARQTLRVGTGSVLLGAPPGTDQGGRDPYVDGVWIARATAAFFADASFAGISQHVAFAELAAEFGSCLYDLPAEIDASHADLASTKVSWFDYVHSVRIDVPYAAACSASPTAPADGWALESGPAGKRVRVCGRPCVDLRTVLTLAGVYALQHHVPPPEEKVAWAPRCE